MIGPALAVMIAFASADAACPAHTPSPAEASFAVAEATPGLLIIEVRVRTGSTAQQLSAVLTPLTTRGLAATLLVAPDAARGLQRSLQGAVEDGHEVGVLLEADSQGPYGARSRAAFDLWWRSIRDGRRTVRRSSGAVATTVGLAPATEPAEIAADQNGIRALLPIEPGRGDQIRHVRGLDGRVGRTRIVPSGPYDDACGAALPSWTPAAFDRAARSAPAGVPGRMALPLNGAQPAVLERWLDDVLLASDVTVATARAAVSQAKGRPAETPIDPLDRPVDQAMWRAASDRLVQPGRLPRTLPGGLNLTEAFAALVAVLAQPTEPATVRLAALGPPPDVARSMLHDGSLPIPADQIRATAVQLAPRLRGSVPAIIAVGDLRLTSGEFLRVMAQTTVGIDPVASPAPPPDPYGQGWGWGRSGASPAQ